VGVNAPSLQQVKEAIEWGAEQEDLLVHCHAGLSRSTSTAWGISMLRGADPLDSFLALKNAQPNEVITAKGHHVPRDFIPNRLIVKHLEKILNIDGLENIRKQYSTKGWTY
jgi:predicted protein tyrosine phosphatase